MSKKRDPEFEAFVREVTTLNSETGVLSFKNAYVYLGVNYGWKGTVISPNYANVVWFMTHGRWPKPGYVLDHINDDPLDNRPCNLQEITATENHKKRRGRIVYRSYGKGKYGYGVGILHDKRDDRYYINRHLSRGHGNGELKTKRICFGGFDTLQDAEKRVEELIAEIKENGLDYIPASKRKRVPLRLVK